jgi:hypothetical protein
MLICFRSHITHLRGQTVIGHSLNGADASCIFVLTALKLSVMKEPRFVRKRQTCTKEANCVIVSTLFYCGIGSIFGRADVSATKFARLAERVTSSSTSRDWSLMVSSVGCGHMERVELLHL